MNARRPLAWCGLVIALTLTGCAAVGGPSRETILRIETPIPTRAASAEGGVIALAPVQASANTSARRYTYTDPSAPREVRFAATLFWEEPPPTMIQHAVVDGLSARLGVAVIDNSIGLPATRRLTIQLTRFEEVSGSSARAIVSLRAMLIDLKTHDLVFSDPFCRSAVIAGSRPTDRSQAFETAIGGILDDLSNAITTRTAAAEPTQC